jgi:hypothetical protein
MASVAPGIAWISPDNAFSSDDVYAGYISTTSVTEETSEYLRATNFGFAIPSNATITGIKVAVERKTDTANGIIDYSILIVQGGTPGGTDQSAGAVWSTTESYITFGGASSLWDLTWTPTDTNSSGFGVQIQVQNQLGVGERALVDHIRITVYYTISAASKFMLLGVG